MIGINSRSKRETEINTNLDNMILIHGYSLEAAKDYGYDEKGKSEIENYWVIKWYNEKAATRETVLAIDEKISAVTEELGIAEDYDRWRGRFKIHSQLELLYEQGYSAEEVKKIGLKGLSYDNVEFAYVMDWYTVKKEQERMQAEKNADYWGKGTVDTVNGFGRRNGKHSNLHY